jgi:hypothetical protein
MEEEGAAIGDTLSIPLYHVVLHYGILRLIAVLSLSLFLSPTLMAGHHPSHHSIIHHSSPSL